MTSSPAANGGEVPDVGVGAGQVQVLGRPRPQVVAHRAAVDLDDQGGLVEDRDHHRAVEVARSRRSAAPRGAAGGPAPRRPRCGSWPAGGSRGCGWRSRGGTWPAPQGGRRAGPGGRRGRRGTPAGPGGSRRPPGPAAPRRRPNAAAARPACAPTSAPTAARRSAQPPPGRREQRHRVAERHPLGPPHPVELGDDDLGVLRSVTDGLVAKTRLRTPAGGIG